MTYNQTNLKKIAAALQSVGLSGNTLLLALAQVAHETNGFNDKKITTHNNPAGITWINKKTIQRNATKGNPLPENKSYFYAKFATLKDWARDYIRIVGNKLKAARSATDYANKLKAGKYYTDTAKNYATALLSHLKVLTSNVKKVPKSNTLLLIGAGLLVALLVMR